MRRHLVMRYARILMLACLAVLPAQALAQTSAAPVAKPITVTTLSHPDTNVLWGRAVGVVDAPMADVVRMVEAYGEYYTFLPHFRTSKVLSQRGSQAIVYLEAVVAMGAVKLWAQVKMGPGPSQGGTRVIEAKLMKGNMSLLEARWELTPVDAQRTNVAFQMLIEPKVPLPASMLTNENVKASRKTITALRKNLALARSKTATL